MYTAAASSAALSVTHDMVELSSNPDSIVLAIAAWPDEIIAARMRGLGAIVEEERPHTT